MWNRTHADLGVVRPGSTTKVDFTFTGDIQLTQLPNGSFQITTSCSCASVSWDSRSQTLSAYYQAKDIPKHLQTKGEYSATAEVHFPAIVNGVQRNQELTFSVSVSIK